MTSYIPITGTFAAFATRFVSPSLGFTIGAHITIVDFGHALNGTSPGWNYWLQWALSIRMSIT